MILICASNTVMSDAQWPSFPVPLAVDEVLNIDTIFLSWLEIIPSKKENPIECPSCAWLKLY